MTSLLVRPRADRDTDEAVEFYAREAGVDVAFSFLAGVEDACRQHVEDPYMARP